MPKASVTPMAPRQRKVSMTSPSGVVYELMIVTPAQAELWLGKNGKNRRLGKPSVNKYGRDMVSGGWCENGSAIVFAVNGDLIDGQHRLHACVDTGVSFLTLVVRGVPREAQNTIDDGKKRSLSDRLDFMGKANTSTAAAVTRRVLLWQEGYRFNSGAYQPSTQEALALLESDPTVSAAIECAVNMRRSKLLPSSIVGLGWWLFYEISPGDCQEFWNGLTVGAGLHEKSPILIVRNQIIKTNAEPGRIPESVVLAWVIKAWNDYRDHKPRSNAYGIKTGEAFPEPK